jgi:hypothetical protein
VREVNGEYELAFGHHRLDAAKEVFGDDHEVSVQVEDYCDAQMLIALADENAGESESLEAQVDVIRATRAYLDKHPEACKRQALHGGTPVKKHGHEQLCEHGSVCCLVAFLGEANWSIRKVENLATIADELDARILKYVADKHPERIGALMGQHAAVAVAKLDKAAQKEVVSIVREANKDLEKRNWRNAQRRNSRSVASVK